MSLFVGHEIMSCLHQKNIVWVLMYKRSLSKILWIQSSKGQVLKVAVRTQSHKIFYWIMEKFCIYFSVFKKLKMIDCVRISYRWLLEQVVLPLKNNFFILTT